MIIGKASVKPMSDEEEWSVPRVKIGAWYSSVRDKERKPFFYVYDIRDGKVAYKSLPSMHDRLRYCEPEEFLSFARVAADQKLHAKSLHIRE
jgi:hypothetical protein